MQFLLCLLTAANLIFGYTEEEIDLIARVVMSEASILNQEAKQAVAEVVVNRAEYYGETIAETVNRGLSTADNGSPDSSCYEAVYAALQYNAYPDDLLYFRTDYPHSFATHYMTIGNTYFSTIKDYQSLIANAKYDPWDGLIKEAYYVY